MSASGLEIAYSKKLVSDFLTPLQLERYTSYFVSSGMTEAEDIASLTDEDLRYIGITNDDHIRVILKKASSFNGDKSKEAELRDWLREGDLVVHFHSFLEFGLNSLEAAASIEPTEEMLDKLEVSLYGHRLRLQRRLRQLKKKKENPLNRKLETVHEGYWNTPVSMATSTKFLCVNAIVKSPLDSALRTEPLPFLVDTGSECSALVRVVLDKLKLPKEGVTTVVGVNSRMETDFYKAVVEIGGEDITVKVVEDQTNAVGIDIFSKFFHVIGSLQHNWVLSLTGGVVGFILSIAGQRLSRAVNFLTGHLVLTVVFYLVLPKFIKIGKPNICCTKHGKQWVHAGLAVLFGTFGGFITIPKRAIGDFVTSACSGALLGMMILTFIPQWDDLFHGHTVVLMFIIIPASLTGAISQVCHQDIRLIPSTATCGSYAVIIAINAFARISKGFSWILKDLHVRANQVMYSDPYTRPNKKETTFQLVDYMMFIWWCVESLVAATIQLCVTTNYLRKWIKRRREPPP